MIIIGTIICLLVAVVICLAMKICNNTTTNLYIDFNDVDHVFCKTCGKESSIEQVAWLEGRCSYCGSNSNFVVVMKDGRKLDD